MEGGEETEGPGAKGREETEIWLPNMTQGASKVNFLHSPKGWFFEEEEKMSNNFKFTSMSEDGPWSIESRLKLKLKLLENSGVNLHDLRLDNSFSGMTSKAQMIKE